MAKGYTIDGTQLIIYDCAGFQDNRGPEINISNTVNLMAIAENALDIRI